jgi:hypothetical protein
MSLIHKIPNQIAFIDDNTGAIDEIGVHNFTAMRSTKWRRIKTESGHAFETRTHTFEYGEPGAPKVLTVSQFRDIK